MAAYIDYSKAFDVVCHNKLLHKLAAYGIAGNLLSWIGNFLWGRSQVTRISRSYSDIVYWSSGVVQGSCIGPWLFLIYVNDVTDALSDSCMCKLYADDLKLYTVIRTIDDCQNLQKCLDMLYDWSRRTWQLTISYKKCSFMVAGCQLSKILVSLLTTA